MPLLVTQIREHLGPAPRDPRSGGRSAQRIAPPAWMSQSDALRALYTAQDALFAEGEVVFGAYVQANRLLFRPGNENCPALVVFATDRSFDARPDQLADLAHRIASLKTQKNVSPALAPVARLVTDEMYRASREPLPEALSRGRPLFAGTTMMHRGHLLERRLVTRVFPILVSASTPWILPLPVAWWPEEARRSLAQIAEA
jgi:hypothetical protein